jgi:hypothetical protein
MAEQKKDDPKAMKNKIQKQFVIVIGVILGIIVFSIAISTLGGDDKKEPTAKPQPTSKAVVKESKVSAAPVKMEESKIKTILVSDYFDKKMTIGDEEIYLRGTVTDKAITTVEDSLRVEFKYGVNDIQCYSNNKGLLDKVQIGKQATLLGSFSGEDLAGIYVFDFTSVE